VSHFCLDEDVSRYILVRDVRIEIKLRHLLLVYAYIY
jgi:hypothetical protein